MVYFVCRFQHNGGTDPNQPRPDLRKKVRCIGDLYIRLRYGRGVDPTGLKRFKALVKNFAPK